MRLLFVSNGNVCRSPFAAGLFNRLAHAGALDASANSAGLSLERMGSAAATSAIALAADYGVDLTGHRSRLLTIGDFAVFDSIAALDRSDLRITADLRGMSHRLKRPVTAELRLFSSLADLDDASDIAECPSDQRERIGDAFARISRGIQQIVVKMSAHGDRGGTATG